MKEVKINRNEQRDLILLRNEIAYYMANSGQSIEFRDNFNLYKEKLPTFGLPELPEPINHHSACYNCPYQIICGSYLSRDTSFQPSNRHPLKNILTQISSHLPPSHIDYFIHWTGLLSIEEEYSKRG